MVWFGHLATLNDDDASMMMIMKTVFRYDLCVSFVFILWSWQFIPALFNSWIFILHTIALSDFVERRCSCGFYAEDQGIEKDLLLSNIFLLNLNFTPGWILFLLMVVGNISNLWSLSHSISLHHPVHLGVLYPLTLQVTCLTNGLNKLRLLL